VTHTRTIRAVGLGMTFVVEDEFDGQGVHDFEFNLQLAPHRKAEIDSTQTGLVCRILGDSQVRIVVAGPPGLQGTAWPSVISKTYGGTIPAMKVSFWGRTEVPARIITRISWAEAAGTRYGWFQPAKDARVPIAVAEEASQA
jgi:hypothetical protein